MAFVGSTPLITHSSLTSFQEAFDSKSPTIIWNGKLWTSVVIERTKMKERVFRLEMSDGSVLNVSGRTQISLKIPHKFMPERRYVKDLAFDYKNLRELEHTKIDHFLDEPELDAAYDLGYATTGGDVVFDKVHVLAGKSPKKQFSTLQEDDTLLLDKSLVERLKHDPLVWKMLFTVSKDSILRFIAGLIDGTTSRNTVPSYRPTILLENQRVAEVAQLLLRRYQMRSVILKTKKKCNAFKERPYQLVIWDNVEFYNKSNIKTSPTKLGYKQMLEKIVETSKEEWMYGFNESMFNKGLIGCSYLTSSL